MVDCRARTRAADRVLAVASTGVGHWAEHVQAQVDADAGRITTDQMQAIFARTRLAGPSDVSAYTAAVRTYAHSNGSCRARPGATSGQAHTLAACSQRQHAQAPVLAAAANAMTDWEQHLSDMRRSRMGQVANAQQVWVHTYHAAPPHIRAYQSAAAHFDAPAC